MYKGFFKIIIDFLFALAGLIISLPITLPLALLLAISNRGNPFFIQTRPGKDNKIFKLIKFKTMNDKLDVNGKLLPDKDRITPIGRFVRSSSIDELPQLINVLKGDMSLIGPRPLLVKYLPLYNKFQSRRHEVKPGITGWTQVNGRNSISWQEKFELDTWYVDHVSLSLDFKIIVMTIFKVFKREGINASTNHTMPAFDGKN